MKPTNSRRHHQALGAITLTCLLAWSFVYLAFNFFQQYAWGLFIWLPFVMGVTATLLYGAGSAHTKKDYLQVSLLATTVFFAGLLAFAWEGAICIAMVLPIRLNLSYFTS